MTRLQAFCAAAIGLMLVFIPMPPFLRFFLIAAIFAALGFIVFDIIRSRTDRYSLSALAEFEDKEAVRRLIEETPKFAGDTIVCPVCMTVYDADLPACPECVRANKGRT